MKNSEDWQNWRPLPIERVVVKLAHGGASRQGSTAVRQGTPAPPVSERGGTTWGSAARQRHAALALYYTQIYVSMILVGGCLSPSGTSVGKETAWILLGFQVYQQA